MSAPLSTPNQGTHGTTTGRRGCLKFMSRQSLPPEPKGEHTVQQCRLYAWVALVSVGLALGLSSCVAQDVKTAPPSTPVPQTLAQPVTSQPALRVGIAPNYPPISFK